MQLSEIAANRVAEGEGDAEAAALRAYINDLLGVLAIPSLSIGRGPEQILGTMLEVLVSTLRLDVAYAGLESSGHGPPPATLARGSTRLLQVPPEIDAVVRSWLTERPATSTLLVRRRIGG